jgi:hypothetical protein
MKTSLCQDCHKAIATQYWEREDLSLCRNCARARELKRQVATAVRENILTGKRKTITLPDGSVIEIG